MGRAHSFYHIHSIGERSVFAFHSDDHEMNVFDFTEYLISTVMANLSMVIANLSTVIANLSMVMANLSMVIANLLKP